MKNIHIRCSFLILLFFISIVTFAQPANDNQASATDITSLINSCSANGAYTTIGATPDQAKGSCWSTGPNYNVWFKFTATATGFIDIKLETGGAFGTLQYPYLALWNSSLTQLDCETYYSQYGTIEVSYNGLTPGATYYISVDNLNQTSRRGTFKLCLSDVVDYRCFGCYLAY